MSVSPFCSECGSKNETGARFCTSCGTTLSVQAPVGSGDLHDGPAFAVAVALIHYDDTASEPNTQKVVWWGHPVTLT